MISLGVLHQPQHKNNNMGWSTLDSSACNTTRCWSSSKEVTNFKKSSVHKLIILLGKIAMTLDHFLMAGRRRFWNKCNPFYNVITKNTFQTLPNGKIYFIDHHTRRTTWEDPRFSDSSIAGKKVNYPKREAKKVGIFPRLPRPPHLWRKTKKLRNFFGTIPLLSGGIFSRLQVQVWDSHEDLGKAWPWIKPGQVWDHSEARKYSAWLLWRHLQSRQT